MVRRNVDRRKYTKGDRRKHTEELFVHHLGAATNPKARKVPGFQHVRTSEAELGKVEVRISGTDRRGYGRGRAKDKAQVLKIVKKLIKEKGKGNVTRYDIAKAIQDLEKSKKSIQKK